jgi:hypothetical protein
MKKIMSKKKNIHKLTDNYFNKRKWFKIIHQLNSNKED